MYTIKSIMHGNVHPIRIHIGRKPWSIGWLTLVWRHWNKQLAGLIFVNQSQQSYNITNQERQMLFLSIPGKSFKSYNIQRSEFCVLNCYCIEQIDFDFHYNGVDLSELTLQRSWLIGVYNKRVRHLDSVSCNLLLPPRHPHICIYN